MIIDNMADKEARADQFLILTILHNSAMCYQSKLPDYRNRRIG